MKKAFCTTLKMMLAIPALALFASAAFATPIALSDAQLDSVAAGGAPSPTGFVCPVIKTSAVLNSPKGQPISGGYYTIGGPNVRVPMHATNADGAGSPGGFHASPGDTNYTAIWYFQN